MAAGDIAKSLRDTVRARIGEPSETGVETVDIYAFLNEAVYDVMWRINDGAMPEMTDLATGTLTNSRVALPATFWREWLVQIGASDYVAQQWDISELDALANNTLTAPSATNPYYFVWYNVTDAAIRLHVEVGNPADSSAYDIFFVKTPTDMSDSVDPELTAALHELLVDYCTMRCREQRGEYGEAERLRRGYIAKIDAINSRYREGSRNEGRGGDAN